MGVTIKDLARELGVSHSTVSRALRNSPEISEAMKVKVRELARERNYRPNAHARNLVSKRTTSVGIILPDIENPFYASLSKKLIRFFENNDYRVLICNSDRDEDKENDYVAYLLEQQVSGLVMIPSDPENAAYKRVVQAETPLVLIDHDGSSEGIDSVLGDNYFGAKLAVNHLIHLGYRRIGHIAGPGYADASKARLKGYQDAMNEAGLSNNCRIVRCDSTFLGGLDASAALLSETPELEAVFAVNDITALAFGQYVYEKNLHIPEDLALVGFDDISVARMAAVPLTTVRQSLESIAREAGDILLDKMKTGYSAVVRNVLLKPELVVRDSCGASRTTSSL